MKLIPNIHHEDPWVKNGEQVINLQQEWNINIDNRISNLETSTNSSDNKVGLIFGLTNLSELVT